MKRAQAPVTASMPWKKSVSGTRGMDKRCAERSMRRQLSSALKRLGRACPTRYAFRPSKTSSAYCNAREPGQTSMSP